MRDNLGRFSKGHKETLAEKEKRVAGLRKAWLNRNDYISDIKDESPYIYNTWRGIMFTEKGKRQGISEEWKDFRTFYNDVRPSYKKGLLFRRYDINKPYSKDNYVWLEKEIAYITRGNLVEITFNGETLPLAMMAAKYDKRYYAVKKRYYNREKYKYTVEEIIFGRKKKRGSKSCKNATNDTIRAKASKMISSYRKKDEKMGLNVCDISIDWMIENILTKPCFYCGDTNRIGCDRIDNKKGHTKENVVPCCVECNTARNDYFSVEEMKEIGATIRRIKENRKRSKK